ncbi:MAG: hypothetical protein SGI72_07485 [Planctomycetota bacterium]|nr:hypothetical protein [Planctomycetota bacterium]
MKTSVRGMAKVSVVWTIIVLVAFLVSIVAFFLVGGELENTKLSLTAATKQAEELKTKTAGDSAVIVGISEILGFNGTGTRSDPALAAAKLTQIKAESADVVPASTMTFEGVVPLFQQALKSSRDRAQELQAQVATKSGELESLQNSLRTTTADSEKQLADLRRQLVDKDSQLSSTQQGYEAQVAGLRESLKTANSLVTEANSTISSKDRAFADQAQGQLTRMNELARKLNPIVKEPQAADGKVLAVSKDLNLGWINLGAKNRLPRGARFTVVSGVQGSTRVKALAEVTRVDGDMAEVAFSDQRDPFDPPSSGDVVFNPVYDPTGERSVLLVGAFSGQYGEDQLKGLLAGMGISVQKKLDASTDFMIVGSEMYVDENKQPVETPIQPSDLPMYKEAVAQGVQIVLLKDLRDYFRF